jgi:hypothetical protein
MASRIFSENKSAKKAKITSCRSRKAENSQRINTKQTINEKK